MREQIMLVVSDKFSAFCAGKDVITISQLRQWLRGEQAPLFSQGRMVLVPGQGLGDDMVAEILELAPRAPNAGQYDFGPWYNRPKRAGSHLSHKQDPHNTLISEPRQIAEDVFEMHLMIDERGELMRDHQSGQHVQGMILIEAARQGPMAVTEAFYLPKDRKFAFVFNDMNIKYNRFAFPLDARLRYTVREKETRKGSRFRFAGDLAVEQTGVQAAFFSFSFSVFEAGLVSRQEGMQAMEALQGGLATKRGPEAGDLAAVA